MFSIWKRPTGRKDGTTKRVRVAASTLRTMKKKAAQAAAAN